MNNGHQTSSGFSLSALSIRQHIGTFVLTVMVVVLGIFFLKILHVFLLPSFTYRGFGVGLIGHGFSQVVAVY